mmetsp:Transcript_15550/g.39389  ORF Transcript_15550/g.39389 Transcript_15550/m.39389 type:complete len:94 (+) Transcript_15550:1671-1952(+)
MGWTCRVASRTILLTLCTGSGSGWGNSMTRHRHGARALPVQSVRFRLRTGVRRRQPSPFQFCPILPGKQSSCLAMPVWGEPNPLKPTQASNAT